MEVYGRGHKVQSENPGQNISEPEKMLEDFIDYYTPRGAFEPPSNLELGNILRETLLAFAAADWVHSLIFTTVIHQRLSHDGAALEWAAQKKDMLDYLLELNT